MKRLFVLGGMLGMLLATGQTFADEAIKNRVAADTADKFKAVAADIRKDMSPGGRYEYITPDNKAKVESDLTVMAEMLQKAGSVNALSERDRVKLFNTQEHLNGLLTHSDSNRLVCERTTPVGTTIPKTTCQTVAEIERNRREGQRAIRQAGVAGSTCVRNCSSN